MTSLRFVVPLAAVVLAVFGTSRVMEGIDPGPVGVSAPTGISTGGGGDSEGDRRERNRGRSRRPPSEESFLSPDGMRSLISLLRDEVGDGGRVTLFRVQAKAAQVQVARAGGGGGLLVIEPGPKVKFKASTPVAIPGGFDLEDLDPKAPQRIRGAIRRSSQAPVDYMVFLVSPIDRRGNWDAFLANADHTHFRADAHGRSVTRP